MSIKPKVAIAKHTSYKSGLREVLATLLDDLGGLDSFVQPGKNVLIKPNMLTDREPDQAVTTHPEVVRAVIHILKDYGVNIVVADSPCSAVKIRDVWEKTGFRALCEEEDIPLLHLEKEGSTNFISNGCSFNIANPIITADLIVNVPKVKTHTLTTLTAAVKNMYGALPGYQKASLHKEYPKPKELGQLLMEIHSVVPPQINIADAIVGMDGNGPSGGSPFTLNFLAASNSAPALDYVICDILGINPKSVPYLSEDLVDPELIELSGVAPKELRPTDFVMPNTMAIRLVPEWLVKVFAPFVWVRPNISYGCVACSKCVEACPARALSISNELQIAVLAKEKCIECCCCQEVCPAKAITMGQSPFLNFLRKGKML